MTRKSFRLYFNKRKQWVDVYISDNSRKFMLSQKCYAYYQGARERKSRRGLFGELHFSRVGSGLVAHELLHLQFDWMRARKTNVTMDNEEKLVSMYGELVRNFWRLYYSWKEKTTV